MKRVKQLLVLAILYLAAGGPAFGQLAKGSNYELLEQPQPTESGKKVEVIEFFWYACPHCNHLEPALTGWLKRKPTDVEFRRIPAVLSDSWLQLARTYYTIEAMGLVDKLHMALYTAIHEKHTVDPRFLTRDPKPLFDWVASQGVDRQKFVDTYNSFAVTSRTNRATDLTRNYDVPYTPVLVVDGRYLISPSMKGNSNPNGSPNYDKFLENLDQLIAQARNKPRAARK
jgi:thiol:disulfide interchange protein DsbA